MRSTQVARALQGTCQLAVRRRWVVRGERFGGAIGRAGDANFPAIRAGPAVGAVFPQQHWTAVLRESEEEFDGIAGRRVCRELRPERTILLSARPRPGVPSARAAWPQDTGAGPQNDRGKAYSAIPKTTPQMPIAAQGSTLDVDAAICRLGSQNLVQKDVRAVTGREPF
jgi:hypothetical protein